MRYLEEKKSNVSTLIENQFPIFVQQNNPQFIKFLSSYYESLENKYHPLDIASNLIEYYNIGHYRPNTLIGQTKLTSNLLANSTTILAEDTTGFPSENGYIKINNEIIFYRSVTSTSFVDCVRGTSALLLENVPKSEIVLTSSTADEHESGSVIENIAYDYSVEFFKRIKSEIAPLITENVVEELDYAQFLKNIKSFYSAKGSLNGHRIIFKILFNDKKYNILLKPRGSGAELKINNYNRYIPIDPPPQIVSGGSGYDNRRDSVTNELINSPVIDILGSGTGAVNASGLRPNETAIVKVTGINSSGSITSVQVVDQGEEYIGPIRSRVRPRSFYQDQKVYNDTGTGYGRVEYWDGFRNELVLYDVVGFFKSDDEIIGVGGESPRAFVSRAFIGTTSIRSGVETIPEVQNIEFPRDYTFKTSNSSYSEKKILKCRVIRGDDITTYGKLPQVLTLRQDQDILFGVSGVDLEVDNITPLRDDTYEFEVSSSTVLNKLYLPPSTEISKVSSYSGSNFIITVDDASRFPVTNGILYINGVLIEYSHRSIDQFFDCKYYSGTTLTAGVGDEVISWGRKKYTVVWGINQSIKKGDFRYYKDNLYKAVSDGITSSINGPSHTSGVKRDGTYADGNPNPVKWEYIGKNTLRHTLYDINSGTEFELIAVPGDVIIVDGGSLHTKQQFEFAELDSPNQQMYYFTTKEISDRLGVVLSSNYNRSHNTVTDSRLSAFGSLTGFNATHDFGDYVYVPTSTIPRWWNEIVDLSQVTLSAEDQKKVSFTNQKIISRYNKSTLIYETRVITDLVPTKQSVAINADAIQVNSYKGNTINYGKINTFTIADGGDYKVIFAQNNTFDNNKLPSFIIKSNDGTEIEASNQNNLVKISSRFTSIDFNKLAELWINSGQLQGFTTKPIIEVINNNPRKQVVVNRGSLNVSSNTFTVQYASSSQLEFKTADKVRYFTPLSVSSTPIQLTNVIPALVNQTEYYISVVSSTTGGYPKTVEYSLHKTESDAIRNSNKISLSYLEYMGDFNFPLLGDSANPIDFKSAEFDLSYNETTQSIDNIIIRDSGNGYIEAPTIKIVGGGKSDLPGSEITIPYTINGIEIIEMRGKLVSYTNYSKENYYEIDSFNNINYSYEIAPEIVVDGGSGAEAVAYVSNGKINSVIPINPGKNYFAVPTVKLIGSGKNAVVTAKIENGQITGFDVINAGEGYKVPVTVQIIPAGDGAVVSARLNEWTFNLVQRLEKIGRIDSFGGYVYNDSDYQITSTADANNPAKFIHIVAEDDLAPSIDNKQYLLLNSSKKLLAKYTLEQRGGLLSSLYPGVNFTYQTSQGITNLLNTTVHSPVLAVAYDGVPVYGNRGYSTRYDSQSTVSEISSRYKLKYSTVNSTGSVSVVVNGTTYYLSRPGGPSISDYPIGSFIEDYEFVDGGPDNLDVHNGRFCVTPEYPAGRYCYFSTTSSFDSVTNGIIQQSNVNFNGFPYFIGNHFASVPDNYTNKSCRTNDKIPKVFNRAVDVAIPAVPSLLFPGLPSNDRYPKEDLSNDKTICRASSLTPGSVESVIIESPGKNYRVGDSLSVDNTLTFGSGFGGFVSKVEGKPISNFIISNGKITVFTNEKNGLAVNDFVYFDYTTPLNPSVINFHNSSVAPLSAKFVESQSISVSLGGSNYKNKKFYSLSLNKKFKYKFNIPNLPYSFTYDIDKLNEYFVIEEGSDSDPTSILFDASKLPNILYLHIGDFIYEISTTVQFSSQYRINSIDTVNNSFTFNISEDVSTYETTNIKYVTKSINATGGVAEISVSNGGFNYRKLPSVGVDSKTGSGAIVQVDSSTIGKIRNIKYLTAGGGFTSNQNVNQYLNLPSTAKIINNFEIYEVEVVDGGNFYNDQLQLLVNGKSNLAEFKINVQLGVITSIDVIDGGSNFETIPELQVVSTTGVGAVLKAKIRRKKLFYGESITAQTNSQIFPVTVTAKTLSFDELSSTFEFDQYNGQFKDGDLLYTADGKKYGRITRIRRPLAYAKVNPYITLESSKTDVSGNTSEFLQKITDSNVYQDWSYILSSSRDTKEWRQQVEVNTHPAGHKLFGKKVIDRRKSFFERPEDVFKTSVIFTANLVNQILLKVKLTPCKDQVIALLNPQDFSVGDYVFGSITEAVGRVEEITEYSLKLSLLTDTRFKIGEYIVQVPASFSFGVDSATSRSLAFWNGIMQEPEYSYESAFDYEDEFGQPLTVPVVGTLIPKFDLAQSDELLHYELSSPLTIYDSYTLKSTDNLYFPSVDNESVSVQSNFLDKTIISVGGVVQSPQTLELNAAERYVRFLDSPNFDAKVFAVSSQNLNKLTFTGSSTGTSFTINYTPSSNCQLLIFYVGIDQSHLLTDYSVSGNTVTFSEIVELANIFGWYVNETVECSKIDVDDLLNNRITGTWNCDTKNFTEFINSSAVKTPSSLYELRKEYLDGTVYPAADGTTLFGFDTRFTYTSPEYSTSFIEVLNKINFDGSTKSFTLKRFDSIPYSPSNGKDSLMVYIDNVVLDPDQYEISGQTIVFDDVYQPSQDCTIIDFNSSYVANQSVDKGANLDRFNVHNGSRTRFNLSDRGVPQYVKNIGDVFAIRNGVLQRPDQRHQSVSANKITFNSAPTFDDTTDLVWFNRQLLPLPTKNVVLDDFYCFDGIRTDFPLTLDGINFYPVNVYHLFIVRNGVYQKPGIDYRLATTSDYNSPPGLPAYPLDGSHVIFSEAPKEDDSIIVFHSSDGLNQNLKIDNFKYFNGIETTFALTKDFTSTTPTSVDHIQVYRNGVYQYSGVDYTVQTTGGGPRITFTTAPAESENVYITHFDTSNYFQNKTSEFSQVNSTTIHYTNATPITPSQVILIFKNGISLNYGWTVDYANQNIIFDENFAIDSSTRIFLVSNCAGEFDKFAKFDGVTTTFALTKDIISKAPQSANHIQVYRNGVYQYSGVDYSVSTTNGGPRITFTTAPASGDKIYITHFDSLTHFTDATANFSQISTTEFQYSSTLGSGLLVIFKDGIIQLNGAYTYNNSTNVLTFSESIDLQTSLLKIYIIGNQSRKLDQFNILDGTNDTFSLTHNYQNTSTLSANDLQVYRNGVYQYGGVDYSIASFASGNKSITFATAPSATDDIYITEVSNTSNFEDITANFVQDNSTTLGNITTLNLNKTLLIFNQGILQNSDSYSYNYSTQKLQFVEPFVLNSLVRIFAVSNSSGVLDSIYQFDGITTTFPITHNNVSITPASADHIQVYRNGVYQYSGVDYTISAVSGGPRITFTTAPIADDNVLILLFPQNELQSIVSDFTQTNSATLNYSGTENISSGILLIFRNGILQVKDSYEVVGSTVIFAENIDFANDDFSILYVENSFKIDPPRFINGNTVTFPLTRNNESVSVTNIDKSFVFRNGVYQYPTTDYTIQTTGGGPRITFTTAPAINDEIFVQNFNTNSGFVNLTSSFTQVNSTTYQYNSTLVNSPLLIFNGGVMQINDSWIFDTTNQRLIFSEPVVGPLNIFQIQNCPVLVNSIITSTTNRYPLRNGRRPYFPSSTETMFVCIDGIVQEQGKSFIIDGDHIQFLDTNIVPGARLLVIDATTSGLRLFDRLETAWEGVNTKYIRILSNYQSFTSDNFYISKDGVVQDKSAYSTVGSLLSVQTDATTDWNLLEIYNCNTSGLIQVDQLQSVLNVSNDSITLKLTKNYQTINTTSRSLIINAEGVIQRPIQNYSATGSVVTVNNSSFNLNTLEIIDVSGCSLREIDPLSDYYQSYTDASGYVHTVYRLRNTYTELVSSLDALVSYGSVVQIPNLGYNIYVQNGQKFFDLITEYQPNLSELTIFEVSKTNYEVYDQLESLLSSSDNNYTLKLLNDYQTISGLVDEEVFVQINGVVQEVSSYNVINSTITLIGSNYETATIYDLSGANLEVIDYLSEDFSTPTFKFLQNYSTYTPASLSDIFVLRESILQNPTEDYVASTGNITFTTLIQKTTDIFIMYTHGTEEIVPLNLIPLNVCTTEDTYQLPITIPDNQKNQYILYLNGVPNFHGKDFNITGSVLSFVGGYYPDDDGSMFMIRYPNLTYIDHLENCPDGVLTKFKLLYQGKNVMAQSSADILTNQDGVLQEPQVDYTVALTTIGLNSFARHITFTQPLPEEHNTFFVRMYGNEYVPLTSVGGSSTQFTHAATVRDPETLFVFGNGNWMLPTKSYTYNNGTVTIETPSTKVFAIEFSTIVKVLDDVHTPFNSNRTVFNMFLDEENFLPHGTISNDNIPDETSILVLKNGRVLDPKVDYLLTGDMRSQVSFTTAPNYGDVVSIKAVGSMNKLMTITTGFNGTNNVFNMKTTSNTDYYPNAEIERPRDHENQILVIKDGYIQSPIYDYYIDNNKIVFVDNVPSASTSKLVVMDFRGTIDDVKVYNRFNQVEVGDDIRLDGASLPRKVTEIISPTVLKTASTGEQVHYGFTADAIYNNGKVEGIDVLTGGKGYTFPAVVRTKGTGKGAKAVGNVNHYQGGSIIDALEIQYPGYNIYRQQESLATVYGTVYKYQPLSKSQIRKATKLSQNINSSVETFDIANATGLPSNPPVVQVTADTGSGATFRVYVSNEEIRKVEILTAGIGYDEFTLDIDLLGGGGTGCVLEPVLDAMGRFTNVIVRNGGTGYDTFRVIVCDDNPLSNSEVDVEFIEYTYVDGNTLLGCTRGVARSHTQGDYVYFDNYL